jgi:RNA polymerase sigma-70 factor, ECF subfamily
MAKVPDCWDKRKLFEQEALPHLDALYGAALRLAHNPDDAEDLMQDTVLRAYRFFHQFTPGSNCRAWLLAILYNTFRNGYRRSSREQTAPSVAEFERGVEAQSLRVDPSGNNPEQIYANRRMGHEIEAALDALPEEFRSAIWLVDVEDLNYQEVSELLDIPIGTVKSRVSRGRAMMRNVLRKSGVRHRLFRY